MDNIAQMAKAQMPDRRDRAKDSPNSQIENIQNYTVRC